MLGKYRLDRPRRGVRDRAGVGHDPAAGHLRRDPRRLHRPAAGQDRGQGARRAPARVPTSCSAMRVPAHAAISTSVDLVRSEVGAGPGRVRQRGAAPGRPRTTSTTWLDRVDADRRDPVSPPGSGSSTRWRRALPRRSARTSSTRCSPPTTSRRRSPWSPGPGRSTPRRAAGRADALLAVRRRSRRAATRARCRPSPRAAPACRTRGRSWSRSPWPRRRSRAPTRAGSTCAPARAARRPCWRPWRPTRGARLVANERQPHRADLVRRALRRRRRASRR